MIETERSKRLKNREARGRKPGKGRPKRKTTVQKHRCSSEGMKMNQTYDVKSVLPSDADAVNALIAGETPPRIQSDVFKNTTTSPRASRVGRYMSPENNLEGECASSKSNHTASQTSSESPKEKLKLKHTPRSSNRNRRPSLKVRMQQQLSSPESELKHTPLTSKGKRGRSLKVKMEQQLSSPDSEPKQTPLASKGKRRQSLKVRMKQQLSSLESEPKQSPLTSKGKRGLPLKVKMEQQQAAQKKQRYGDEKSKLKASDSKKSSIARPKQLQKNEEMGVFTSKSASTLSESMSDQSGNLVSNQGSAISAEKEVASQPNSVTHPPKSVLIMPKNADSPSKSDTSISTTEFVKSTTEFVKSKNDDKTEVEGTTPHLAVNIDSFDTTDSSWKMGQTRESEFVDLNFNNDDDDDDDDEEPLGDDDLLFKSNVYYINGMVIEQGCNWVSYISKSRILRIRWCPGKIEKGLVDVRADLKFISEAHHFVGIHEVTTKYGLMSFGNFIYVSIPAKYVTKLSKGPSNSSVIELLIPTEDTEALSRFAKLISSAEVVPNTANFNRITKPLLDRRKALGRLASKMNESEFTKSKSPGDTVLVYPFRTEPKNIISALASLPELQMSYCDSQDNRRSLSISTDDFLTLQPNGLLSDSIIDLWAKLITHKQRNEVLLFSCLFFDSIAGIDGPKSGLKWIKNVNIFEKRLILIPVNQDSHWSVVALINLSAIFKGGKADHNLSPSLVFFDSLDMHDKAWIEDAIVDWVKVVVAEGGGDTSGIKDAFFRFTPPVSKQTNCVDCGVFVCLYIHALIQASRELIDCSISTSGSDGFLNLFSRDADTGRRFHFNGVDDIQRVRKGFQRAIECMNESYVANLGVQNAYFEGCQTPKASNCAELPSDEKEQRDQSTFDSRLDESVRELLPTLNKNTNRSMGNTSVAKEGHTLKNREDDSSFAKDDYNTFCRSFMDAKQKAKANTAGPKPRSAYVLFCKEKRSVVKSQYPDKSSKDVSTLLSIEWKNFPPDKRSRYKLLAAYEKRNYDKGKLKFLKATFEDQHIDRIESTLRNEQGTEHLSSQNDQSSNSLRSHNGKKSVRINETIVEKNENEIKHCNTPQSGKVPYLGTNYFETDIISLQRVRAFSVDLDGIFSIPEWTSMSDIERRQHIKTRLASTKSHTMSTPYQPSSHTQNFSTPRPKDQQQPSNLNQYATHFSSTPARNSMLNGTINTSKSQIKSKGIVNNGVAADSLKGSSLSKQSSPVESEFECKERVSYAKKSGAEWGEFGTRQLKEECKSRNLATSGNKEQLLGRLEEDEEAFNGGIKWGLKPIRVEQVLKKDNRRMIKRSAVGLVQRNRTQLKCKASWPKTFQIMGQYNEFTRNDSGKAQCSSKFRKVPQWNFIAADEDQLKLFKESVCSQIDYSKYDFHFTTCPDEFTNRLGQDDNGNSLSAGASVDVECTLEKLRKKKKAQKAAKEKM